MRMMAEAPKASVASGEDPVAELPGRMGQTSSLGSLDELRTATPRAEEVAPVDFVAAEGRPATADAAAARRPAMLTRLRRALFGD